MAAVTIYSDFGAQKSKVCHCFHCSPINLPWNDGTDTMILVFWVLSFKPAFSLSSFTFGFRGSSAGKESTCNAGGPSLATRPGSFPGDGIGYPLQFYWASLVAHMVKNSACSAGGLGSIPGLGRSPGEGHGNPLQYSCLENPHRQRTLAGYSCKPSDVTQWLSTAFTFIKRLFSSSLLSTIRVVSSA